MSSPIANKRIASDVVKNRARIVQERLTSLGLKASLQQAYEILAASEGYKNWATMKAAQPKRCDALPLPSSQNGFWPSVLDMDCAFPALLMGADQLTRTRLVRAASKVLGGMILRFRGDQKAPDHDLPTVLGRSLERDCLVYIEVGDRISQEMTDTLCAWLDERKARVVVGVDHPSIIPSSLVRRFVSRYVAPQIAPRIPREFSFEDRPCFTIFGRSSQHGVDADLMEYATFSVDQAHGIVLGSPAFEEQVSNIFPPGSHLMRTSTLMRDSGENDDRVFASFLSADYNHVWIQNLEEFRFASYEERTGKSARETVMYAYDVGMAPCGGIVAANRQDLFRKIITFFPKMIWEMGFPPHEYCRDNGRLLVRVSHEGEDCSEAFLRWVRSKGFAYKDGVVTPDPGQATRRRENRIATQKG